MLIIFHGSANNDGCPGHQRSVAEKTDSLHAIIEQAGIELPGSAMGGHHCDQAVTAVPGIVPFFLLADHLCILSGIWRSADLKEAEMLLVARAVERSGERKRAII